MHNAVHAGIDYNETSGNLEIHLKDYIRALPDDKRQEILDDLVCAEVFDDMVMQRCIDKLTGKLEDEKGWYQIPTDQEQRWQFLVELAEKVNTEFVGHGYMPHRAISDALKAFGTLAGNKEFYYALDHTSWGEYETGNFYKWAREQDFKYGYQHTDAQLRRAEKYIEDCMKAICQGKPLPEAPWKAEHEQGDGHVA